VRHSARLVVLGFISGAVVAGTSVLASGATAPQGAPGVTSTKVNVGAIVSESGPLAADFAPYLSGVNAYFDYVNAMGGVHGRQIDLAYPLDDASNPTTDINDAQTLVSSDHAFAIVGVSTPFFNAHKFLSTTSTPVFGYATGNVWGKAKNLFADYGSVLNFNSSIPFFAYVAKQTKSTNAAVIALDYPASQDECKGALAGLKTYKIKVAYQNIDEQIGANWSIEATKMRDAGVNMVINCMDVNSDISLSKALSNFGVKPVQLWLDGYDRTILSKNSAYMQDVYFLLQHVPFEAATAYPAAFPGLNLYFTEMQKYGFTSDEYSDVALMGWESANLFTVGLRDAGKNPTQKAVIAAINKDKRDVGGPDGGVTAPINWTIAHNGNTSPGCETFVKVTGTSFVLAFNHGSHPWVCFPLKGKANLSKPVAPPPGTPGA
jgi:branched-chain amino acid transport system substrate-binding protein